MKTQKTISDLEGEWLDLIDIRNNSPYNSAKYNRAEKKANEIENQASMMVYGDTTHTMSECINREEA
jgi:hypothetical protein